MGGVQVIEGKNISQIEEPKKARMLQCYAETGSITDAAKAAGISPGTHYHWKKNDPLYLAALAEAEEAIGDRLEAIARERAMSGKSDLLLIFLLKGQKPDKYRDQKVQHDYKFKFELPPGMEEELRARNAKPVKTGKSQETKDVEFTDVEAASPTAEIPAPADRKGRKRKGKGENSGENSGSSGASNPLF